MFCKRKLKSNIVCHPEIFNNSYQAGYSILDSEIPDKRWFLDNNELGENSRIKNNPKRWYLCKPILIPLSVVLMITVIIIATPTGRTTVNNLYETVVHWMKGEVYIWKGSSDKPQQEIENEKKTYDSVDEVKTIYHVSLFESTVGKLELIEVIKSDYQTMVTSTYSLENNNSISITQTINDNETNSSVTIDTTEGQPVNEKTSDGLDVIGYVNEDSGYAIAFLSNNIKIEVYSENTVYDDFVDFIVNIKINRYYS